MLYSFVRTTTRSTTSLISHSTSHLRPSAYIFRAMSSLSSALISDHRELESYYKKYQDNAGNSSEQQKWLNQFTWELARHSIGEELLVYPSFEDKLGAEGKKMADEDRQQHQSLKNMLYELQNMSAGEAKTDTTFARLMKDLREHIKQEEERDLPKLEQKLSREDSQNMFHSFERTKMFVPTRSHPSAPDKPPFETLAGLLAAPMDKLGDIFRKFPTKQQLKDVEAR
eukprot:TRINITY_DN24032_c0_g1_i1.p1 TRINITY_DN24032_c0_g1~~TRINITY_DN24032_c0_g1_i1.p1  ORF type:complete len:227 (-),score=55.15 TRINITY_DN24032_c0_g1_i1:4-684(-)